MEVEESNKLIAEFMGMEVVPWGAGQMWFLEGNKGIEKTFNHYSSHSSDLRFSKSWDWLMPVVQKCYKIDNEERFNNLIDAVATLDLEATYKAVVEFIQWYNKNQKDG